MLFSEYLPTSKRFISSELKLNMLNLNDTAKTVKKLFYSASFSIWFCVKFSQTRKKNFFSKIILGLSFYNGFRRIIAAFLFVNQAIFFFSSET
jgi:hypothetical protein